ncbi:hypothetical protein Goari_010759 [Gossypium aridum]|uniref:Alpha-amylase/branching enzyme C-terminal all beta domain-containing protein n=1 Tax=Gossypium aridum TaxID=34290 RepID=A0A7J8Y144_GOSAI|nr:hypothetical protein [Gossypium aridum]
MNSLRSSNHPMHFKMELKYRTVLQVILNTDERRYGGQGIVKEEQYLQRTISKRVNGLRNCIEVSLPSRTAQVGVQVKPDFENMKTVFTLGRSSILIQRTYYE